MTPGGWPSDLLVYACFESGRGFGSVGGEASRVHAHGHHLAALSLRLPQGPCSAWPVAAARHGMADRHPGCHVTAGARLSGRGAVVPACRGVVCGARVVDGAGMQIGLRGLFGGSGLSRDFVGTFAGTPTGSIVGMTGAGVSC